MSIHSSCPPSADPLPLPWMLGVVVAAWVAALALYFVR